MILTLVVEDEPLVAEAHRRYVERVPGFAVAGVVNRGGEAVTHVEWHPVDLVLLDFYLPDIGGLDVCRILRARSRKPVDIIAVTSARDVETVRQAVSQGVVQYLIKPFTFTAFRDKLESYAEYRRRLDASGDAAVQTDVDDLFSALRGPGTDGLPKGLSRQTWTGVVQVLRTAEAPRSASEVGAEIGVARVSARRYLEHLVEQGLAVRSLRYGGSGRPEQLYAWPDRP